MKKLFTVLLVMLTATFIWAADEKPEGMSLMLQGTYYPTSRFQLDGRNPDITDQIYIQNLGIEGGIFRSNEDGFLDWVGTNSFNFQIGPAILNGASVPKTLDLNFSSKNTGGLQLNFFMCSIGITCGLRCGYEFTSSTPLDYLENKIFLDFINLPFFSVNIGKTIKVMVQYEYDLPIVHFRFIGDNLGDALNFRVHWFEQDDVNHSIKAGIVLFI